MKRVPIRLAPIILVPIMLVSCQSLEPAGAGSAASRRSCPSEPATQEISRTIRAFFDALARDDDEAVSRLTTADFYAFEIGKRYSGPELSRLIADAHRAGRIMEWNIGTIDARVDCNLAFAAWENSGAAGTAARLEPRAWLESALLLRQGDRWVLRFLHSTPKDPRP